MTKETVRHEFFQDLKKLLNSSESNYRHNRSHIGQKKLIEAQRRIIAFLGDNLPGVRARDKGAIFIRHIQAHLEPDQVVICKICGKSVDQIFEER